MAFTFGKGNRSIAFNPTSAFPLDARSYFESYQAALNAAALAQEAGSTEAIHYFGQEIVVVENGVASFYIIQTDGTLTKLGREITFNEKVFEHNNDGKLDLYGFANAVAGAQLTKGDDGTLVWKAPSSITVEGLDARINEIAQDLSDYYYTKSETDAAITAAQHLKRKKVNSTAEININAPDATQYIYMIPSGLEAEDNKYYEYMIIETLFVDSDGVETTVRTIEKVGSWEVNLEEYAKTEEVNTALDKKVDKIEGHVLISQADLDRLANVQPYAEPNFIKVVNNKEFTVTNAGELNIAVIPQTKIEGLTDHLTAIDSKLTNVFTDALKEKLEAINLNDIENMKTSVGSLKDTIYGYKDEETGRDIPGLVGLVAVMSTKVAGLEEVDDELIGRIETLEAMLGDGKDENGETIFGLVATVGNLETQLNNLTTEFNNLDNKYVSITNFNAVVGNIDSLLTKQKTIVEEINEINERLTWGLIDSSDN